MIDADSNPEDTESTELNTTIREVVEMTAAQETLDRVSERILRKTFVLPSLTHQGLRTSLRRAVSVTAACSVAIVLIAFLLSSTPHSGLLFAQVQQRIEETRTVQYVEYMHEAQVRDEIAECRAMIEEAKLEEFIRDRRESSPDADIDSLKKEFGEAIARFRDHIDDMEARLKDGKPIVLRRVWIQGRYLKRDEQHPYGQKCISISNAKTGEEVSIDTVEKTVTVLETQTVLGMKSGEKSVTPITPRPTADFYANIASVPAENVRELPGKVLRGKEVLGFEQIDEGNENEATIVRTYWINKVTKLPVQLDAVATLGGEVVGGSTISDFVFDQPIDPVLFSTTPPDGYAVRKGTIMGLDPEK